MDAILNRCPAAIAIDRDYLEIYPAITPGGVYQMLYDVRMTPPARRDQLQRAVMCARSAIGLRGNRVLRAICASDVEQIVPLSPVERAELAVFLASLRQMDRRHAFALCGRVERQGEGE